MLKELPAGPIYVALFVLKRIQESYSLQIVEAIVYSVKYFYISVTLEDLCDMLVVRKPVRSSKKAFKLKKK